MEGKQNPRYSDTPSPRARGSAGAPLWCPHLRPPARKSLPGARARARAASPEPAGLGARARRRRRRGALATPARRGERARARPPASGRSWRGGVSAGCQAPYRLPFPARPQRRVPAPCSRSLRFGESLCLLGRPPEPVR